MFSSSQSATAATPTTNNGTEHPAPPSRSAPANVWQTRETGTREPSSSRPEDASTTSYATDGESWPEVGKVTPSTNGHSGEIVEKKEEAASTAGTHRKEKHKWVPIPAEELQAAADAARPRTHPSSRGGSQYSSSRPPHSRGAGTSGSRSASRDHSANPLSRDNNRSGRGSASASLSASASVSQVQSRSGSVQSSPRHNTRGRRLPPEEGAGALGMYGPGVPPPRHGSGPGTPIQRQQPYYDPSQNSPYGYPNPQQYPPMGTTYYHQPPHFMPGPNSSQGPYGSGSPMSAGGFTLPMPPPGYPPVDPMMGQGYNGYPSYPGYYQPPPFGYWGAPPGPGGYNYGNMNPPPPSSSSSSVSALSLSTEQGAGVPPRSMQVRPPPPSQSQAIAGYRQIAPVATPVHSEVPLPRGREMVFGSVGLPGGMKSPSPVNSPSLSRVMAKANEGEADDTTEVEKGFQSLSIGIPAGEQGPPRARSHTRQDVPEDSATTKDSETKESDSGLGLTQAKWEFGTTSKSEAETVLSPAQEQPPQMPQAYPYPPYTQPFQPGPPMPSATTAWGGPAAGDEFEVRDFGYGFGSYSGSGFAPEYTKEQGLARERERAREREVRGGDNPNRPRRSSYSGGFDRGNYGGRRGRGFGGRGGFRGNGGFRGGGSGGYNPRGGQQVPPFTVTPPAPFMPLPPPQADSYYLPSPMQIGPPMYGGPQYDMYYAQGGILQPQPYLSDSGTNTSPQPGLPPMPLPQTTVPFPLDTTRMYLLGQLEYYLSAQNMAQDLFLRKQMNSEGWIPISLLANFNRVRALTTDAALVREVFALSSIVELQDDLVRMRDGLWKQFVLPTMPAVPSASEKEAVPQDAAAVQKEEKVEAITK